MEIMEKEILDRALQKFRENTELTAEIIEMAAIMQATFMTH
jgi:hypothetical protein